MKKKLLSILAICFIFISLFTFSGCGEITLSGGPSVNEAVTGNGSVAVQKGNYLYFVNGFVSNKDLKGADNSYGVARNGAIYRAELSNNKLMYDVTTNEDGEEVKTLKNVELLVPMVAGFENTSLYICGETLFYTSPNTEKDNTGAIRFDLTDIFAINLRGGKPVKISNAVNFTLKNQFIVNQIGNFIYLTYLNGSEIYNVKISGASVVSKVKVAENVSSIAYAQDGDEINYVYYTRSFKESENNITGNVLAKTDVTNNEETILYKDNFNTYEVKKVANGKIYYTKTNSLTTNAYIYSKNLENFILNEEKQYTAVAYTNSQYILDIGAGYNNGVIVNENDKLLFLTGITNPEEECITLYDGAFTMLGIYGENIYGKDAENNIIRVNIQNKEKEILVNNENINLDMTVNFDYDNGYIYYYVKYTGNDEDAGYYLNRTYVNQTEKETELVGIMLEKHIKTVNE